MTITELFAITIEKPDEFWDVLSDGEFKMKSLFKARYPGESWRQLQRCCWQVIRDHGNRPADRYIRQHYGRHHGTHGCLPQSSCPWRMGSRNA